MPMFLSKNYKDAADGMAKFVKNAIRTDTVETRPMSDPPALFDQVVLEGDFEVFSLALMDVWGGHLRFVFVDTEAKDEDELAARGSVAMSAPDLAAMMTAKATLTVWRRDTVTVETIRRKGNRELSRETREEEEWKDVTQEFAKLASREHML